MVTLIQFRCIVSQTKQSHHSHNSTEVRQNTKNGFTCAQEVFSSALQPATSTYKASGSITKHQLLKMAIPWRNGDGELVLRFVPLCGALPTVIGVLGEDDLVGEEVLAGVIFPPSVTSSIDFHLRGGD